MDFVKDRYCGGKWSWPTKKWGIGEKRLTLWHPGGFGDFRKKTAVFGCLTNALAPPLIALESCSRVKRIGQSGRLHSKKNFFLGVAGFL